jgi:hypothetical protein
VLSPTIYTVNSTGNSTSGSGTSGTLPYVISQANVNSNPDGSEIEFDSSVFSTPQTIALGLTPLVLSEAPGPEVIDGPGAGLLTILGAGTRDQIDVKGNAATISGMTLKEGNLVALPAIPSAVNIAKGSSATLVDCTITGVGASYGVSNAGTAVLNGVSISHSWYGVSNSGTATLTDCTISGSNSPNAVLNAGNAQLIDCTISGNFGEGVANNRTATLEGSSITNNYGGGVFNLGAATLTGCTVSGNYSPYRGHVSGSEESYDGMLNYGTANLTDCTINGNHAKRGGGFSNYGTANLTDCTISGNSAQDGGGLYQRGGLHAGTATLIGCTISGNDAQNGGGLFNYEAVSLTDCTISGNSSSSGVGGVGNYGSGTVTLTGTIVAGNTGSGGTPSDIGGPKASQVSGTYNLIGTGGSGGLAGGTDHNIVGVAPFLVLGQLGDYGGPTQTLPLLPGSPAIGAGTAVSGVSTDQRGFPLDSPNSDIGAFQSYSGPLDVSSTADGGSPPGTFDLRGAIDQAGFESGTVSVTFDPTVFATLQTITLTQGPIFTGSGSVAIVGPSAGVVVSGGGKTEVFDTSGSVAMSGLTITDAGEGTVIFPVGGVMNTGHLTLTDCTISDNSASPVGGLENIGSATLVDCTISGNSALRGGGLINYGTANLTDCTISDNSSSSGVGGVGNYGSGTVTLTGTIVAGNTGSGGNASDIGGPNASQVSGTYNLIGTGGSGGLTAADHNLLNVADPLLSPLGNYGGPTETIALLPGSPAIGAGVVVSGVTTDERGMPLDSPMPDIGAFQSQGFTLTPVSGSTPQSATINTAFANPLAVTVTANDPLEPVAGGVITFAAPSSGASAGLSGVMVTIGPTGVASVTATANGTAGSYTANATTSGAAAPASFALTNTGTGPINVTSDLAVTYGGFVYNRTTRHFTQTLTIQNISGAAIAAPIELGLLDLQNATLVNQSGTYQGNPYITILSSGSLAAGQILTFSLIFADSTFAPITYTAEFLSGPIPSVSSTDWIPSRKLDVHRFRGALS